jgi:hypothetical protein
VAEVEVRGLRVRASGTLDPTTALAGVSLVEDVDRDGAFGPADRELAPVTSFSGTPPIAELSLTGAVVRPDESRRWLLRVHPATGASLDGTLQLVIADANAVDERTIMPVNALVPVTGSFPLTSALYGGSAGGDGRPAWRTSFTLPADGSGDGADLADPDHDGAPNLLEYALGTSPVDPSDVPRAVSGRDSATGRFTLTYARLRDDISYLVEKSGTLAGDWTSEGVDQGTPGTSTIASVPLTGSRQFLRLVVTAP